MHAQLKQVIFLLLLNVVYISLVLGDFSGGSFEILPGSLKELPQLDVARGSRLSGLIHRYYAYAQVEIIVDADKAKKQTYTN